MSKNLTVLAYLSSLDEVKLKVVIELMHSQEKGEVLQLEGEQTCQGVAKPTDKPTPNGTWVCTAHGWVWVPEIG